MPVPPVVMERTKKSYHPNHYSTFRRRRIEARQRLVEQLKRNVERNKVVTLHWDGIIVHRCACLVSRKNWHQMLGIPKCGESANVQKDELIKLINDWKLSDAIRAFACDTPNVNMGEYGGICSLIERSYGRQFFWLACRHHISELMITGLFEKLTGETTKSPGEDAFKDFKAKWPSLRNLEHSSVLDDFETCSRITNREELIQKFLELEAIKHPRGDYQLLVKVALAFLGHPNVKLGISNMLSVSHARWMSKIIYCFYIYLFRNHYDLPSTSKITTKTLSEVCVFGVTSYIFYFLQCPDARSAPRRDLELLKAIFSFDYDQTKMVSMVSFRTTYTIGVV
jgi:hypothetical protein